MVHEMLLEGLSRDVEGDVCQGAAACGKLVSVQCDWLWCVAVSVCCCIQKDGELLIDPSSLEEQVWDSHLAIICIGTVCTVT